jgi:hypothetical protein
MTKSFDASKPFSRGIRSTLVVRFERKYLGFTHKSFSVFQKHLAFPVLEIAHQTYAANKPKEATEKHLQQATAWSSRHVDPQSTQRW